MKAESGANTCERRRPSRFDLLPFAKAHCFCKLRYSAYEMADHSDCMPLEPESIRRAHATIERYIHKTPLQTSRTVDRLCSSPSCNGRAAPRMRLYFKCENMQKIGAFKARGAFHALSHLIHFLGEDEVRRSGVVTQDDTVQLLLSCNSVNCPQNNCCILSTADPVARNGKGDAQTLTEFAVATSDRRFLSPTIAVSLLPTPFLHLCYTLLRWLPRLGLTKAKARLPPSPRSLHADRVAMPHQRQSQTQTQTQQYRHDRQSERWFGGCFRSPRTTRPALSQPGSSSRRRPPSRSLV